MIDLKAEYGDRFRVALDESSEIPGQSREDRLWLYQIPCRLGNIFIWGEDELGAHARNTPTKRRLMAIPGVTVRQEGDREVNVSFPPELFDQVAELLQPRKRRRLSPERRAALIEAGKPFAKRPEAQSD